jgi:hypothetical protein
MRPRAAARLSHGPLLRRARRPTCPPRRRRSAPPPGRARPRAAAFVRGPRQPRTRRHHDRTTAVFSAATPGGPLPSSSQPRSTQGHLGAPGGTDPPAVKMQVPGHWHVNESAVGRQLSPGAQDALSCSRSAAGSLVDRSRHASSPGGSTVGLRSRVLLPRCSSHGHSASHAHAHAGGGSWMSVSPAVQHIS